MNERCDGLDQTSGDPIDFVALVKEFAGGVSHAVPIRRRQLKPALKESERAGNVVGISQPGPL